MVATGSIGLKLSHHTQIVCRSPNSTNWSYHQSDPDEVHVGHLLGVRRQASPLRSWLLAFSLSTHG